MLFTDPLQLCEALGIPYSSEQLDAITAPLEPGVIIAGSGTGKTAVMAARVVWLVGSGQVNAEQVLGLTFTRKAAGELGTRVSNALLKAGVVNPTLDTQPVIQTYDSFARNLVNEYGFLLGLEADVRLLSGPSSFRLADEIVRRWPAPLKCSGGLQPDTLTFRVRSLAEDLQSHLVTTTELRDQSLAFVERLESAPLNRKGEMYADIEKAIEVAQARVELLDLVDRYREQKVTDGYVEFSDLMSHAALLSELPQVSKALRKEFAVVLLDEYQDTSAAQARLLAGLFSGKNADLGRGHPVSAVGDPCQAIYGWRGAAASNITEFTQRFLKVDGSWARSYPLTRNRRSGQAILNAANELSIPIRNAVPTGSLPASLELVPGEIAANATINTAAFDTELEELAWIRQQIVALHDSGEVNSWRDIAALSRTNATCAQIFTELIAHDIPAEIVGLGGLLEFPAVADVVSTLKLLADPSENPALVRLLTSAKWAIGKGDLVSLGRRAKRLISEASDIGESAERAKTLGNPKTSEAWSLLEAARNPGRGVSLAGRERLAQFTQEFAGLRSGLSGSLVDLCQSIAAWLGAENELLAVGADIRLAGLSEFLGAVAEYEGFDDRATLSGFLDYLKAAETDGAGLEQPAVSNADSVKLLTVHKAKGLEFDTVFLAGLSDSVFPSSRVTNDWVRNPAVIPSELRGDELSIPQLFEITKKGITAYHQELVTEGRLAEDRLAYVAVTRAKSRLYASWHAWRAGRKTVLKPSPYFEIISQFAATTHQAVISQENPLDVDAVPISWPDLGDEEDRAIRVAAAGAVSSQIGNRFEANPAKIPNMSVEDESLYRADYEAATMLIEQGAQTSSFTPNYLSVTGVSFAASRPKEYRSSLLRPMPKLASRSQREGTIFHEWVQGQLMDELPLDLLLGAEDENEEELIGSEKSFKAAFAASPYAKVKAVAIEAPFTLKLGGVLVRGRIDAVFPGAGKYKYQIVDWKTGNARRADPMQLAMYRLAWAELQGVSPAVVDAVFFDLSKGEIVSPKLADRASLEAMVLGIKNELGEG